MHRPDIVNRDALVVALAVFALLMAVLLWPYGPLLSLLAVILAVHLVILGLPEVRSQAHLWWVLSRNTVGTGRVRILNADPPPASHSAFLAEMRRLADARLVKDYAAFDPDPNPLSQPSAHGGAEIPIPPTVVADPDSYGDLDFDRAGIFSVEELADSPPEELAEDLGIEEEDAEDIVLEANLFRYGAGIESLMELAMLTPDEIVDMIQNGPWRDVYDSESDLAYLHELADGWIRRANKVLADAASSLFDRRRRR